MNDEAKNIVDISENIKKWVSKEEQYLYELHIVSIELSKYYSKLYERYHSILTSLRIPVILLSSIAGLTSFGYQSFPKVTQQYLSIATGVINVTIAMLQTYESYFKIGDTVTKCLAASESLRKLGDDIHCEIFLPVNDRGGDGIDFLRESFTRYQSIMDQAPPLSKELIDTRGINEIFEILYSNIKKKKLKKQIKSMKLKKIYENYFPDKNIIKDDSETISDYESTYNDAITINEANTPSPNVDNNFRSNFANPFNIVGKTSNIERTTPPTRLNTLMNEFK